MVTLRIVMMLAGLAVFALASVPSLWRRPSPQTTQTTTPPAASVTPAASVIVADLPSAERVRSFSQVFSWGTVEWKVEYRPHQTFLGGIRINRADTWVATVWSNEIDHVGELFKDDVASDILSFVATAKPQAIRFSVDGK